MNDDAQVNLKIVNNYAAIKLILHNNKYKCNNYKLFYILLIIKPIWNFLNLFVVSV